MGSAAAAGYQRSDGPVATTLDDVCIDAESDYFEHAKSISAFFATTVLYIANYFLIPTAKY